MGCYWAICNVIGLLNWANVLENTALLGCNVYFLLLYIIPLLKQSERKQPRKITQTKTFSEFYYFIEWNITVSYFDIVVNTHYKYLDLSDYT